MFAIIGILLVFAAVIGGFLMEKGQIMVLVQPAELLIIAGAAAKSVPMGLGIGVGAGAAAGLIAILAIRGPDAVLTKGSTVEMILDRPLSFSETDLNFGNYQAPRMATPVAQAPVQAKSQLPLRK